MSTPEKITLSDTRVISSDILRQFAIRSLLRVFKEDNFTDNVFHTITDQVFQLIWEDTICHLHAEIKPLEDHDEINLADAVNEITDAIKEEALKILAQHLKGPENDQQ
jgi:hypothetical protein